MKIHSVYIMIFLLILSSLLAVKVPGQEEGETEDGLDLISISINTVIENHYAVTEFEAEIFNPTNTSLEKIFSLELPEDAMLTNMSITINGTTTYARVATSEEARKEYNEAKENGTTASQATSSSSENTFDFFVNVGKFQNITFTIRYEQVIARTMGRYHFHLDPENFEGYSDFEKGYFSIFIMGIGALLDLDTSSSTPVLNEDWDGNSSVLLTPTTSPHDPESTDIIDISFAEEAPPIEGTLITHIDGTGGYFMHVFSPRLEDLGSYLPKDIIFVLDRSGSMSGEKIEQMKDAFEEIIYQLHGEDRFDLITFSSDLEKWKEYLVDATGANKESAAVLIRNTEAGGGTNINDALLSGLGMFDGQAERVPVIVFLTDGQPTSGVTSTSAIRQNVLMNNENGASIYSLGFGADLDLDFLQALSLENNGFAVPIPEGGNAGLLMTGFYDTISTPLVMDLRFGYDAGSFDVIPGKLPSLYQGSEAVIVGRFDPDEEEITSSVTGTTRNGEMNWTQTFDTRTDSRNEFVKRLWAHRMIRKTLDDILVEGELESLVEKVTSIALNYSFVTPYTSFVLVTEEPPEEDETDSSDTEGDFQDVLPTGPGIGDYGERTDGSSDLSQIDNSGSGSGAPPPEKEESDEAPLTMGDGSGSFLIIVGIVVVLLILIIVGALIFSRLREDELLKQKNRKKIYEHIMNHPGDHFRAIQRAVGLEVGTLSHHMNILEKEQLIVSEQDGNNRCFWVAGVKRDTGKIRLSRIQENILKEIQKEPGITQVQIARRVGVSRKVVFYHVKFLTNAQMVMEEKIRKRVHYYPLDG
ncbi:MAG: hypothetical protein DRN57_02530 [Thermoplasmata archaeon]|nr:MAG: hypothetical protein DRN57_02530 [Thermoplasmata archaeon]